jgi:Uri superfamily endonuclease
LGTLHFSKGFYVYVGSALNGLEARVRRHLRANKRHHWHIDHLLDKALIYKVVLIPLPEKLECALANAMRGNLVCIPRFGSSDCLCPGHLFYAAKGNELETHVIRALAQ